MNNVKNNGMNEKKKEALINLMLVFGIIIIVFYLVFLMISYVSF